MPPSSARQYSVCRMTVSCNIANTEAPTIGPVSVWMPPSSTITRPSIERLTWMVSGEIEPLAKANSPPATPQTAPAIAKPSQCTRLTSMPMASARSACRGRRAWHSRTARTETAAAAARRSPPAPASADNRPSLSNGGGGQTPITPLEPPVNSSHWNTAAQTICAKASVSMAR